jgi:hypothetical protein
MKIYFAWSIRGGRNDRETYMVIIDIISKSLVQYWQNILAIQTWLVVESKFQTKKYMREILLESKKQMCFWQRFQIHH